MSKNRSPKDMRDEGNEITPDPRSSAKGIVKAVQHPATVFHSVSTLLVTLKSPHPGEPGGSHLMTSAWSCSLKKSRRD